MISSFRVAFRKEMMRMRLLVSVCTIETDTPTRKPSVTNRCSRYVKRSSSKVNVGRSNTLGASMKSRPSLTRHHFNCCDCAVAVMRRASPSFLAIAPSGAWGSPRTPIRRDQAQSCLTVTIGDVRVPIVQLCELCATEGLKQ